MTRENPWLQAAAARWGSPRTRTRALTGAVCAASFALGAASPFIHPPIGLWAVQLVPQSAPWTQRARRLDPRPGSLVKLEGLVTPDGKPARLPPEGKPHLLVSLWGCGTCSVARKLSDLEVLARDFPGIGISVMAVTTEGEGIEGYLGHPGVAVVRDATGAASRRLNAVASGRAYLLEADGRLSEASPVNEAWERTVDRIRRFARRHRAGN